MFGLLSRITRGGQPDRPILDEVPRYPPFLQGLPAVGSDRIVSTQQELIEAILQSASPDAHTREHYLSAIRAFAGHAHLLPASQAHHHRGAGGLFRHSLEVGLYALQMAHKHLAFPDATPASRREIEPRWAYAAFFCGLYHDAGKPCTDVVVFDAHRRTTWNPVTSGLTAWAEHHGIDRYYLEWRQGRGRTHVALSQVVALRLIADETLDWIMRGGVDLMSWMSETLADNPSPANPLHAIVIKADQMSVERDLRGAGMLMAGHDIGLPVERMLQDIMRRFVREGQWLVNCPGARVWKLEGQTYLVWPAGGDELAEAIRREKLPGMPRSTQALLEMMIERGLAAIRNDSERPLWRIAPAMLEASLGSAGLTAIRLRTDDLVSAVPLADVDGVVLEDERSRPIAHTRSSVPSAGEGGDAGMSMNARQDEDDAILGEDSGRTGLSGPAWEVLSALAEDIAKGERDGAALTCVVREGEVYLRWPVAVEGYGIEPKTVLDEMKTNGWIGSDPMAPMRNLVDADFKGARAKAVWLKGEAAARFIEIASVSARGLSAERPSPAPVQAEADVQGQQSGGDLIDRLIDALVALGVHQEDDGWGVIQRYRVISALKRMQISDPVAEIGRLCAQHPERLVVKGNSVFFRLQS